MKEVLDKITPSKEERERVHRLAQEMVAEIRKLGYHAEVMGSIAKETWVSGEADIDIFVFFSQKTTKQELERKGLELGKKIFKKLGGSFEIGFAEHPYVKGEIRGIGADIVPCYKLKKVEIKSAVDRTPFHTHYVNKRLKKPQRKEVLLLKQFCRGQEIYGSELKTEGLSGYLCEILILRYGTFSDCIDAISKWKEGKIIDIEEHYLKDEAEKLRQQFRAPLIAIDPVDLNRNVAAVLSRKNLLKLIKAAKGYRQKPSEKFFFQGRVEPMSPRRIKGCMFVVFPREKVLDDIIYPQMRSTAKKISTALMINGFEVLKEGAWANGSCVLVFRLKSARIPKKYKHYGPPLEMKEHTARFRKKYKSVKKEGKRLVVLRERKYQEADAFLKAYLRKEKGIASHLDAKKAKMVTDAKSIFREDFGQWLTKWYNEKD
ncbi:MAG: CCA tRNA nucleotidyltransferase [archaeon]